METDAGARVLLLDAAQRADKRRVERVVERGPERLAAERVRVDVPPWGSGQVTSQ